MGKPDGLNVSEIVEGKREAILQLAEQHGASNVRIFGSVARGDTHPQSDIDFLVHFPPDTSIFRVIGLWRELTTLLGCSVDLLTDGALDDPLKAAVLQDSVPL